MLNSHVEVLNGVDTDHVIKVWYVSSHPEENGYVKNIADATFVMGRLLGAPTVIVLLPNTMT